jgi:CPA2 family monovalent cation:H+ antiporter-2
VQQDLAFMADLTVAVVAASVSGFVAVRLRLNPILGYIIAGIVIGPFTPGYVASSGTVEHLAELGLIFLLFSIGLGFSLDELRHIGVFPVVGNVVLMGVFVGAFALAGAFIHLPHPVELGLIMTLSSTAIGVAILAQWGISETPVGRFVIAALIVQDLIAAVLLVLIAEPATSQSVAAVVVPLVRAGAFVAIALVLGATLLRRLVTAILKQSSSEALFGACASIALVAAWLGHLSGLSFEFGAFIAGAVVSEAAGSRKVQEVVEPFRALFVSLFFVAMGMTVDPSLILRQWQAVAALGGAFVVLRLLGWAAFGRLAALRGGAVALAGIALLPLGEFNIALVNAAAQAQRITKDEHALFLGIAFVSILAATVAASAMRPREVATTA